MAVQGVNYGNIGLRRVFLLLYASLKESVGRFSGIYAVSPYLSMVDVQISCGLFWSQNRFHASGGQVPGTSSPSASVTPAAGRWRGRGSGGDVPVNF